MALIRLRAKSTPKSLGSLRPGARVNGLLCAVHLVQPYRFGIVTACNNLRKSGHRFVKPHRCLMEGNDARIKDDPHAEETNC